MKLAELEPPQKLKVKAAAKLPQKKSRSSFWVAVSLFAGLTILFFKRVIFDGHVFFGKMGDMHLVNFTWSSYFKEMMAKGILPLWHQYAYSGYPYGAGALSNVNLNNLLTLVTPDIYTAWNVQMIAIIFFSALFTYLFMMRMTKSPIASVTAGLIFGFSSSTGSFIDSWGVFIPLLLWQYELYQSTKKARYFLLGCFGYCMMILNALPQYTFYAGVFLSLYALLRHRSLMGAAIVAVSGGLTSFYVFRLAESLTQSGRGALWFVNVITPVHLINMIFPFLFESPYRPETNFFFAKIFYEFTDIVFNTRSVQYIRPPYLGIVGFSCLLFAWKAKGSAVFFKRAALAILLYFMTYPFLAPIYKQIPILAQLPRIQRLGALFTFVLAVVSGFGMMRLAAREVSVRAITQFYLWVAGGVAGVLLVLRSAVFAFEGPIRSFAENYIHNHMVGSENYSASPEFYMARVDEFFGFVGKWTDLLSPSLGLPLIFITLSLLCFFFWKNGKISRTVFFSFVTILLAGDLYAYYKVTAETGTARDHINPNRALTEFLKEDTEIFRVMPILEPAEDGVGRVRDVMAPNLPTLDGLASPEGYEPMHPGRYSQFIKNYQGVHEKDPAMILVGPEGEFDYRMTDFLNVKYFITKTKFDLKRKLPVVYEDAKNRVYLNKSYLPRAYLVADVKVIPEDKENLMYLASDAMSFPRQVVLEENPLLPLSGSGEPGTVEALQYDPHELEFQVNANRNAVFVLSENDYPGWKTFLNGKPTKIYRANYNFRAVEVPKGQHTIRFEYHPRSYQLGLRVTIGSLLLLFLSLTVLSALKKVML